MPQVYCTKNKQLASSRLDLNRGHIRTLSPVNLRLRPSLGHRLKISRYSGNTMPWFCADAEPRSNARSHPGPDRPNACFETTLAWLRGRPLRPRLADSRNAIPGEWLGSLSCSPICSKSRGLSY